MVTKSWTMLAISLAFCVALGATGCTEQRDVAGQQTNNGADAGDVSDDAALDAGDDAAEGDASTTDATDAPPSDAAPECTEASDCPVDRGLAPACDEQGRCTSAETCAEGYVDLNDSLADGCEAAFDDSVFVSPDGDDANDGLTPDHPLASIQKAIETAGGEDRGFVLVAGGTYHETLDLAPAAIYGGFDADGWTRDLGEQTTVIEPVAENFAADTAHFRTVTAQGLHTEAAILDGLTIHGFSPDGPTQSTYVVWARDSNDLVVIRHSRLVAGDGSDGTDGANGTSGGDRNCSANPGGAGGASDSSQRACDLPTGARAPAGQNGQPVQNGGGSGGLGGIHACKQRRNQCDAGDGDAGQHGQDGANGANAAAASSSLGQFSDGLFVPPSASAATDGNSGAGGGGGGAGGSCEINGIACTLADCNDVGGDGGKGGAGGCGGSAGQNGNPGGASFGVLAINTVVHLSDTDIVLGNGGEGGDGGDGGEGGHGGSPSSGQPGETQAAGVGGVGGFGGDGGIGGNGAGGCGAPSVGVALVDGGVLDDADLRFDDSQADPASGGSPGSNSTGDGAPGCVGEVRQTVDYDSP